MKPTDFRQIAKKRWGKAASITGNGRYALVARCDVITITLWAEVEIAKARKKLMDMTACGEMCGGTAGHEIVDLGERGSTLTEVDSGLRS